MSLESQGSPQRAIEDPEFPFEYLSEIAELESWRKEISRPVYHMHKWWAQRLGSVFRAILIGTFAERGTNLQELFYTPSRFEGLTVFDPFMGSGTTVGEALKLGVRAIGRDINPVSHFIAQNAFGLHDRQRVLSTYRAIQGDVAPTIRHLYQARFPSGETADVLYYFWVKVVDCLGCQAPVDLFSSYIFAHHSYPSRSPEAHALCPQCGVINSVQYNSQRASCGQCRNIFNPRTGPAHGTVADCPQCHQSFRIADAVRRGGGPPKHRCYAKLVLLPNGSKKYMAADRYDAALYDEASALLRLRPNTFPVVAIQPGNNTNQVLNYCYVYWHQMFSDRQLVSLGLLADRIRSIPDDALRRLFTCLFSGVLEFNNMFASYKGEGTGAVRHMFSHHILKPERTPLEANVWGTERSSGAFSTLFESRLLRALDYKDEPFEIRPVRKNGKVVGRKVFGLSRRIGCAVAGTYPEFAQGSEAYLSCGDSASTDILTGSVDAVVTDPPFFDNVHYSELADFFHVWQRHILAGDDEVGKETTRSPREVQQTDPAVFTQLLGDVWLECHRVLRDHGLLVFTYHHSRAEGWRCVLEALMRAGFVVVAAHPIKAEMSVATPKHQAAEPIDLDMILVCRKRDSEYTSVEEMDLLGQCLAEASVQVARFNGTGRLLSRNDARVVLMGQLLRRLSAMPSFSAASAYLDASDTIFQEAISKLVGGKDRASQVRDGQDRQLSLPL